MNITMDDSRLLNVTQLQEFLKGSRGVALSLVDAGLDEKYKFISDTIKKFEYTQLSKKEKRLVYLYLRKITGYKKAQLYRLMKKEEKGKLKKSMYKRTNPHKIYTGRDIKLLEKTDELHLRMSEKATLAILKREAEFFGHKEFQAIAKVSHAHITNLRHSPLYISGWINHTKARQTPIGETRKPENYGKPGSIRVDSVSQKDVYHINTVDEITQWEIIFCVPQICEACMIPALTEIMSQYPFKIFNFHSDRGGENINVSIGDG